MTGYGQFCPVAVACEVFAQRWTPLILREIFAGSRHFNEIHRGLPQISRTLLATRLRQLEDAGVVTTVPSMSGGGHEYQLTDAGEEFRPLVEGLGAWGQRWTVRVDTNNLDAGFLMWNLRRRVAVDQLPAQHLIVEFRFRGLPERHRGGHIFWLVLSRPDVELCLKDPGADVDLLVDADLGAFAKFWLGDRSLEEIVREKSVHLVGRREWIRAFPSWLLRSHFSAVPRLDTSPADRHAAAPPNA